MVDQLRSWFRENHTLVIFLIAQAIAVGTAAAGILAYTVRLETRVSTLEIRGSPHLERIDNRLTVLESRTKENGDRLERVVDVMTRELNKSKP